MKADDVLLETGLVALVEDREGGRTKLMSEHRRRHGSELAGECARQREAWVVPGGRQQRAVGGDDDLVAPREVAASREGEQRRRDGVGREDQPPRGRGQLRERKRGEGGLPDGEDALDEGREVGCRGLRGDITPEVDGFLVFEGQVDDSAAWGLTQRA